MTKPATKEIKKLTRYSLLGKPPFNIYSGGQFPSIARKEKNIRMSEVQKEAIEREIVEGIKKLDDSSKIFLRGAVAGLAASSKKED